MIGINYYKADASTHVIRTTNGKVRASGRGLSFFYNPATTSIAAVPVTVQDAPFIFCLQTSDFQEITVQGQMTYRVADPMRTSEVLNFTVAKNGRGYVSEDPGSLSDRIIRAAQAVVQTKILGVELRATLTMADELAQAIVEGLAAASTLETLGLTLVDVTVANVSPTPETARALEAQTREEILKRADDAIYGRRKFAVEQERTIKEAELDTDRSVQEKEQEIEALRIEKEREILRSEQLTERERLQGLIEAEQERQALVQTKAQNSNSEADANAYAIRSTMAAYTELPVEHLKAMALAQMSPDQLMAMALETFALNAEKIGELNLTPDVLQRRIERAAKGRGGA